MIVRLAYILDVPLKEIGELLVLEGVQSKETIDKISQYFKREFRSEYTLYMGNAELKPYRVKIDGEKKRVYMRFRFEEHEKLSSLAFALDMDVAPATGLLIKTIISSKEILFPFLSHHIRKDLDDQRLKQLRLLCRYVDSNTPGEYVTLPMLLTYILKQCFEQGKTLKQKIRDFIDD
ncbi:hypothetical protein [Ammoniphilus resinae]|nr:hypothetical protein [Ammoniphilus resinae]